MGFAQTEAQREPATNDLMRGGTISVTIGGAFPVSGTFQGMPQERVDQFVTRILVGVQATMKERQIKAPNEVIPTMYVDRLKEEYPRRGIRLRHVSGEERVLDLERFRLTGDFSNNPYVKTDDVLIFPAVDPERDFVSITGAVQQPIRFQFVRGDRLSDAVLFAGGLSPSYDSLCCATISRLDFSGQHDSTFTATFAANPRLRRGDRIVVPSATNDRRDFRVTVIGEVNSPGSIPVSKNSTTLRDVIRRAGGFKPTADLSRSELVRGANVFQSLLFSNEFEHLLMARMAVMVPEDSVSFSVDNLLRVSRGNGLIDFARVLNDSSREGDFLMRDGDVVFIPERLNLVYVFGQVNSPGYVLYVDGENPEYYLLKAGGIAETAKGEVFLIKGKSRSWLEVDVRESVAIEPGDFLWVPKRIPRTFDYYLVRVASLASVIAALGTVAVLLRQF
jgi:protein involved in polysaccharide export with SLBB domain